MTWRPLVSAWSQAPDACWDPYIAWAAAREFTGLVAALERARRGPPPGGPLAQRSVTVAFEIKPPLPPAHKGSAAYQQLIKQLLPPLAKVGKRFASGSVRISDLPLFLDPFVQKHLPRAEICLPVAVPPNLLARKAFASALMKPPVPATPSSTGTKVFAAVIDDGCAFANAAFWSVQGGKPKSRLQRLWFQEDREVGVNPKGIGFDAADLDKVLAAGWRAPHLDETVCYAELAELLRSRAALAAADDWKQQMRSGAAHGTHVLDVVAGAINPLARRYQYGVTQDAASSAHMIFVQLPRAAVADTSGASMTSNVIEALAYVGGVIGVKGEVVVNLSYGALAGPHDGTTILEEAMDHLRDTDARFRAIVLPAGNGYESRAHAKVLATNDARWHAMPLQLLPADPTDTFVELWYAAQGGGTGGAAVIDVELMAPDGSSSGVIALGECKVMQEPGAAVPTVAVLHVKRPTAGNGKHMALVAFAPTVGQTPTTPTARHGTWTIRVRNRGGQQIAVDAWIERDDSAFGSGRSRSQAAFLSEGAGVSPGHPHAATAPIERQSTLNSFAHGAQTLVVAGCSLRPRKMARYSASGPGRKGTLQGADVTAPCEDTPGGALLAAGTRSAQPVYMNGTSVAAAVLSRQCINATIIRGCLPDPDPQGLQSPPSHHPDDVPLADPSLRRGRGLLKPI